MKITFKLRTGEGPETTVVLNQDIIKIGKLQSSHLYIDDPQVSRMHAVLEDGTPDEKGPHLSVIDLGSASGTKINGLKFSKGRVQSGDTLTVGDTTILVEYEG